MAVTVSQMLVKVGADTTNAEAGLERVKKKMRDVADGAQQAARDGGAFGDFLKGAVQQMLGFSTALGALHVIGVWFNEWREVVIDFNASLEQTEIAFTTMLGSAEASQEMLEELQKFAAQTPFSFPELVDASRRLLAMGYAAEDVIPILTDVGNAAAALGLGNEGIDRITLALGQMRAATKVNAQDMRQLTETGIPAWQILADALGKTVAETQQLVSEGQVASQTFIDAFRQFSQLRYGDMMAEQAKTFNGAMQNIKDTVKQNLAEDSRGLFNWASGVAQRIANALQWWRALADEINRIKHDLYLLQMQGFLSAEGAGAVEEEMAALHTRFGVGLISGDQYFQMLGNLKEQFPELAAAYAAAEAALQEYNAAVDGGLVRNMEYALTVGKVKEAVDDLAAQQREKARFAFELKWADSETQIKMLEARLATLAVGTEDYISVLDELNVLYQAKAESERNLAFAMADHAGKIAMLREELAALKPESTEYNNKMRELVLLEQSATTTTRDLGYAMRDVRSAIVTLHPATQMTAAAVAMWEAQIEGVNAALRANQAAVQRAQGVLQEMQEHLGDLNEMLAEAKERLDEFAHPRLTGMGEMEMQINALQAQLDRVKLAESLGVPLEEIVERYPLLTEGAEEYLSTLPTTQDELQKLLEQMRLMYDLSYDERLRLLEQAANPPMPEMDYETALAGIAETQTQIGSLTAQIAAQEAAIAAQQKAVEALQAVGERLNETLRVFQERLQEAQSKQTLVNQALELAYQWFLEDRQKMIEMGSEGVTQAAIVDQKARELLGAVSGFAGDTTAISEETLAGLVSSFQESSAQAVLEVQESLGKIPTDIWTTHHVVTVYEGAALPGRATGGPVAAGRPYIVGESGPEVFVPSVSGLVLPGKWDGFGAAGGGDVHVTVNVQGSVVAERDLAETVRRELLRAKGRNGAIGLT